MKFERLTKVFESFIPTLKENGLTDVQIKSLKEQLDKKMKNESPPTIAIVGFTGVGKSSTLNALFNAGQPTSDVKACTQEATSFVGDIETFTGSKGIVNIYDMPGLGEDIETDIKHYKTYEEILPLVDVVVWTFQAGDRAMTPTQQALTSLVNKIGNDFTNRLIFVVNKADATAPGETYWDTKLNIPNSTQMENIKEFEDYIREKVKKVLPKWNGAIITYSAKRRFRLDQLMTAMVEAMPDKRKWLLNDLADVADYTELIDPKYMAYISSLLNDSTN